MSSNGLRGNQQFQHSQQWKLLLFQFTQQLPVKSNVRSFKNFPDSFTGRDALSCIHKIIPNIFEPNKCTIDAARNLMNFYLDKYKFIVNVKDENNTKFEDNTTLYRLNWPKINEALEGFAQHSNSSFVRRTGSLRGSEENFNSKPSKHIPKRQQASFSRASTNLETLEFNQIDGRLSISYNDINNETKDSPPQKKTPSVRNNLSGMIVGSISRASASIFSLNRSASATGESSRKTVRTRSNPKFLDEAVLKENKENKIENKEEKIPKIPNSGSKSVFRVRTSSVINCSNSNNAVRESRGEENLLDKKKITSQNTTKITTNTTSRFRPHSVNSFNYSEVYDEYKFWHSSLLNRLIQQIPVGIKFDGFIPLYFAGADLRWNCRHINPKNGIVDRIKENNEELPRDLVSSLRLFCSFNEKFSKNGSSPTNKSTDDKSVSQTLITSKNVPILFESLKEQLSKLAPIIPVKISFCLKNILNLYTNGKGFIEDLNNVDNRLLIAFRLCLLTLQPNKLRNLQILCKYIQRISLDKHLLSIIFNEEKSLEKFLQSFSIYFIQTNGSINLTENTTIFSILINKSFECLFSSTLPKLLEEDVHRMIKSSKSGSALSPSDFPSLNTFCNRINKSTYEQQSKLVDPHLFSLLEAIISNENNMSLYEKEEKLRAFRTSYPSVYLQKFPTSSSDPLFNKQLQSEEDGEGGGGGNALIKNFIKIIF